jgi:cation transport protein ChaC
VSNASYAATAGDAHDLWVFAYGSLMWRPGFAHEEAVRARLTGYRRCFCIYSVHHRGTPERPGMVLGLDRGGVCDGIAFRVRAAHTAATLAYLRAREQVTGVYREALLPVTLEEPQRRHIRALCYLVERAHPGYAGALPLCAQARLVRGARGVSGINLDYFFNTLAHLGALGIREPELERLASVIGAWAGWRRDRGSPNVGGVRELEARTRSLTAAFATRPIRHRSPSLRPGERKRFVWRKTFGVR